MTHGGPGARSLAVLPAGNPSEWTGPGGNNTYLLRGALPALIDPQPDGRHSRRPTDLLPSPSKPPSGQPSPFS